MTDKAWRFGEEQLKHVKEVLESGLGASTEGAMDQRLEQACGVLAANVHEFF